MERGFRDMKTVDAQIQGKAHILPGRRGHDQAQPPAAAQFQQPAGKGVALGIMIVAQENGVAPGQGGNGGKAPGVAFFIDHENGPGQIPCATRLLNAPREGDGQKSERLAPSSGEYGHWPSFP